MSWARRDEGNEERAFPKRAGCHVDSVFPRFSELLSRPGLVKKTAGLHVDQINLVQSRVTSSKCCVSLSVSSCSQCAQLPVFNAVGTEPEK